MYTKSHAYYDEAYSFKDYGAASRKVMEIINERCPHARTLLDVACGTGRHLQHLSTRYACTGIDLNENFLALARKKCGDVQFRHGNMVDFDLGMRFDVVTLLFSSIGYVKYKQDMVKTVCNLERHLADDGIILIEPYFTPESYWTGRVTANHVDRPDLKICWMYTTAPPVAGIASENIKWMIGTPSGIEVFDELHEFGLFSEADLHEAFDAASLDYEYDPVGLFNRGLYVLRRRPRERR